MEKPGCELAHPANEYPPQSVSTHGDARVPLYADDSMCTASLPVDNIVELERRLASQSDLLEDLHFEAAMKAQIDSLDIETMMDSDENDDEKANGINCLSPYEPSTAPRISAMLEMISRHHPEDENIVFLDIGCGDGRVCLLVLTELWSRRQRSCDVVGVDVSPLCIQAAQLNYQAAHHEQGNCHFFPFDMTRDPRELFYPSRNVEDSEQRELLAALLRKVTVIYLYTFPTLLNRLIPLLSYMFERTSEHAVDTNLTKDSDELCHLRLVISNTYHINGTLGSRTEHFVADVAVLERDEDHDLVAYSLVREKKSI
jgi:SAM-dependent methyltransferase